MIIILIFSRWFEWVRWKDLFILWYHFNVEDISHFYIMLSDHDESPWPSSSRSWHHPRVSPAPVASSAVHVVSVGSSLFIRIPDKISIRYYEYDIWRSYAEISTVISDQIPKMGFNISIEVVTLLHFTVHFITVCLCLEQNFLEYWLNFWHKL